MAYVYPEWAVNKTVSHLPKVKRAVDDAALKIGIRAEALLQQHFYTGESDIEVDSGDVDAYVSLVDPAAVSIEYGRKPDAKGKGGMKGLHILGRAAKL